MNVAVIGLVYATLLNAQTGVLIRVKLNFTISERWTLKSITELVLVRKCRFLMKLKGVENF